VASLFYNLKVHLTQFNKVTMYCLIADEHQKGFLEFKNPRRIIQTYKTHEIEACLQEVGLELKKPGSFAAGFVAYEAAPAFDEAFEVYPPGKQPLLCFGCFDAVQPVSPPLLQTKFSFDGWSPSKTNEEYEKKIKAIKHYIAEGDTYQVNYTFKLSSRFKGDPKLFFLTLQNEVKAEYAAYIELDDGVICSFSPELFFTLKEGVLTSKPMKGTDGRGMNLVEDHEKKQWLEKSEKNRAENVMIVDMIRNDMGRIAETGSVKVDSLFDVKKHPYVFQMTSTVVSRVKARPEQIFPVLFPCASITGAPKVRTMRIIKELEQSPRGVYTGAMGYMNSNGDARFSVAIRTLIIDKASSKVEFRVGSGIVWDSEPESEYEECLMKSGFLQNPIGEFKLIEALLWDPETGYLLYDEHLKRLSDSADYFDFPFDDEKVREKLQFEGKEFPEAAVKIRLLLDREGEIEMEVQSLAGVSVSGLKLGFAGNPVASNNRFLYHKTTRRTVYEQAKASRPDCDDVILWNEKGEVTETCRANIVMKKKGVLVTPPIKCGLLPGTFREHLLKSQKIREGVITRSDLETAERIFTINSVRRWMDCNLILDDRGKGHGTKE
jgi:para-aminobenzoate synthetase / 4-amino-4-deoxychorismate lyase